MIWLDFNLQTNTFLQTNMNPKQPDFQLGIHDLENSLTKIGFPTKNSKNKATYSTGNGKDVDNADEAAELFLEREFSQVVKCKKTPHAPIFVPDTFIFNQLKSKVTNILIRAVTHKTFPHTILR